MAENVFAVTQTPLQEPTRIIEIDAAAFSEDNLAAAIPGRASVALLSCGSPVDGVTVEIRDELSRELPETRIGEIFLRSSFLFSGYYNLPEQTAEKLKNGWYATGDRGFVLEGELFVTGRIDDMLIIAGRNYYAHEIEAVVNDVPTVIPGRNVALAVEDGAGDSMAVAILAECAPDADLDRIGEVVRREVFARLGLAVHAVVPLPKGGLIKTTSGKISRSKNLALYLQRTQLTREGT